MDKARASSGIIKASAELVGDKGNGIREQDNGEEEKGSTKLLSYGVGVARVFNKS